MTEFLSAFEGNKGQGHQERVGAERRRIGAGVEERDEKEARETVVLEGGKTTTPGSLGHLLKSLGTRNLKRDQ